MSKFALKVLVPIILVGAFAMTIFLSINIEQLNPSFYIILLLLTLYVFFFGLATGQNISSPIKQLLDRATELSKGNLSSRVYLESEDELGDLAVVFNKIADELQRSQAQGEGVEKTIDIKVKARTQEMQETINALEQKVKNRTIELERLMADSERNKVSIKNKEPEVNQGKLQPNNSKQKPNKTTKVKQDVVESSAERQQV
jgi:methyl-accepting chemotaxis protein